MYDLKYRVTKMNDTICIVYPKCRYNHYMIQSPRTFAIIVYFPVSILLI